MGYARKYQLPTSTVAYDWDKELPPIENTLSSTASLSDHLLWQLSMQTDDQRLRDHQQHGDHRRPCPESHEVVADHCLVAGFDERKGVVDLGTEGIVREVDTHGSEDGGKDRYPRCDHDLMVAPPGDGAEGTKAMERRLYGTRQDVSSVVGWVPLVEMKDDRPRWANTPRSGKRKNDAPDVTYLPGATK